MALVIAIVPKVTIQSTNWHARHWHLLKKWIFKLKLLARTVPYILILPEALSQAFTIWFSFRTISSIFETLSRIERYLLWIEINNGKQVARTKSFFSLFSFRIFLEGNFMPIELLFVIAGICVLELDPKMKWDGFTFTCLEMLVSEQKCLHMKRILFCHFR